MRTWRGAFLEGGLRLGLVVAGQNLVMLLLDIGDPVPRVFLQAQAFVAEPVVSGAQILGVFYRGRLRRPVLRTLNDERK